MSRIGGLRLEYALVFPCLNKALKFRVVLFLQGVSMNCTLFQCLIFENPLALILLVINLYEFQSM